MIYDYLDQRQKQYLIDNPGIASQIESDPDILKKSTIEGKVDKDLLSINLGYKYGVPLRYIADDSIDDDDLIIEEYPI